MAVCSYNRLEGQVAIVTGSGTGIGKQIALGLAGEGAIVVTTARRSEKIEETKQEILALGGQALSIPCDISNPEDCKRVIEETVKVFGKVDILVNNASIFPNKGFLDSTPEEWRSVIDINLNGTYFMSKAAVEQMLKQGKGNIINIATAYVRMGQAMFPHYCASKAGVMMLTRGIAAEFGQQGIRCNAISPGYTPETEGAEKTAMPPEFEKEWVKTIPMGRKASPDEYVGIVVFLASDESSYMTGQTISYDGGMTMP